VPFLKSLFSNNTVGTDSPVFQRQQELGDLSKQFSFDYAMPEGKKLLGQAEGTLQQPIDYWSKLLGGDRASMMSAVAPEAKNIMSQYDTAKQNISKFTPYGGGQTALLSELPFKEGGDIQSLIQKLRPQAASELEGLGKAQAGLSGMVTGEGLQASGQAGNEFNDLFGALLGQQKMNNQSLGGMGSALADLLLMV